MHGFVGSSQCVNCHKTEHHSYLLTAHSRAMSLVDPDSEPTDNTYRHELSGREFQVQRKDGVLWHSEKLLTHLKSAISTENELPAIATSQPVKYLVGSGRHSRTYLVEIEGFLMESPITFYQSKQKWDMSPGYNHPHHEGFERAADLGCVICHVGQAEPVDGALHRLSIEETAIGCERCHGPGEKHVAKWQTKPLAIRDQLNDTSIVHPGKLSRDVNEAICAQCHLRGDATVVRTGKMLSDFQPGMLLSDIRIDYQLETDAGAMKVVGHVDQMHASSCYKQSGTMTCTTCHDMHAKETSAPVASLYRQKCLECHSIDKCGLTTAERILQEPADNCVKCHMPQVETDIPHIAFTHHRIGIHKDTASDRSGKTAAGRLLPFGDISHVSFDEQQRCLGLGYAEVADKEPNPDIAQAYRGRAVQLLNAFETTHDIEGDGDVLAALARFAWENQNATLAIEYASRAMNSSSISDGARVNCLLVSGDSFLQLRQSQNAIPYFEKLVQLRRRSQDWYLLGIAQFQSGQKESGMTALQHAIEIQPFRPDLRETLADMCKDTGRLAESEVHRRSVLRLNERP